MNNQRLAQDLYKRLMGLDEEAFAAGLFNVAYHSLSAALECAIRLPTDEEVLAIESVAAEQLAWIDQNEPEYEHSTSSAATRGRQSVCLRLSLRARAVAMERKVVGKLEEKDASNSTG